MANVEAVAGLVELFASRHTHVNTLMTGIRNVFEDRKALNILQLREIKYDWLISCASSFC
jgi:hypothetical protein